LSSPIDGQATTSLRPSFSWTASAGASSYNLQIATDSNFTNIVASATDIATNSYRMVTMLPADTMYYWRVQALNACGTMAAINSFRTPAQLCTTSALWTGGAISDAKRTGPTTTTFSRSVTAPGTSLTEVRVRNLAVSHNEIYDLDFSLTSPSGKKVPLIPQLCGGVASFTGLNLSGQASEALSCPLATGTYTPLGSMASFEGTNDDGNWILSITDNTQTNTGSLNNWQLETCTLATAPARDYSDSPGSYGAAWHTGTGALKLGATWDADTVFGADSDDGSDDGVTFLTSLRAGQSATVRVNVQGTPTNGRWLMLWFDWDGNGAFDSSEKMVDAVVNTGNNDISFVVPITPPFTLYYRVRLFDATSSPAAGALNGADNGEVEDGRLWFSPVTFSPSPLTINGCESVQVSVMVNDVTDLYSADIQIGFAPAVLEVVDVQPGAFLQGTVTSNTWDNVNGTITYVANRGANPPVSGSGALLVISFRAKSAATGSVLSFASTQLQEQSSDIIQAAAINSTANTVAPAAPALSITQLDATNVRLSWGVVTDVASYSLYRDLVDPYFTPGVAYQSIVGTQIDDAALGDVNTNHFYVARSVCATGFASDVSNRVGEIEFTIVRDAYNTIALPLIDGRYTTADQLGAAVNATRVSQWNAGIQGFDTRVVGSPFGTNFGLSTGFGYVVYTPGGGATTLVNVGGVSNVTFSITRGATCQLNLISLPLNQGSLTQADVLATSIGGVPRIAEWRADTGTYNTRVVGSPFGTPFPTRIGYPYWPCAIAPSGSTWP